MRTGRQARRRTVGTEGAMAESRWLTANEIALVQDIFGSTINTRNVAVVRRPSDSGGFAPWGSVRMGDSLYALDYIGSDRRNPVTLGRSPQLRGPLNNSVNLAHFFLHELVHVWQHFVGMPMAHARGQAGRQGRRLWRDAGRPDFGFGTNAPAKRFAIYDYEIVAAKPDLLDYNMEQQAEIVSDYFALTLWRRPIEFNDWIYNSQGRIVRPTQAQLRAVLGRFLADPAYPMQLHGKALWRVRAAFRALER
jgi:hypothetical protein